ncbi:MAG: NADH-quinone oxidoreductase subunit C [Vampirovibrionia bacterium]
MSEDQNTNNTELTLKRIGIFLKEKGLSVQPLPESSDVVETILIDKTNLLQACQILKDDKDMVFDLLISVSAVDRIEEKVFELVYHLFSTKYHHKVILKVKIDRDKPSVHTVSTVWITADWHERETYDLMGIEFENHPNLTRLLMPSDWKGHPLRKDYVQDDERLIWNER